MSEPTIHYCATIRVRPKSPCGEKGDGLIFAMSWRMVNCKRCLRTNPRLKRRLEVGP